MTKHTLTIEFASADELIAYIKNLGGDVAIVPMKAAKAPKEDKPAPKEAPPAEVETIDEAAADQGYTPEELTVENVTKLIMQVGSKKGKDAAKAVLSGFENLAGEPCARASELQPDDYAAALDKIKEALATA